LISITVGVGDDDAFVLFEAKQCIVPDELMLKYTSAVVLPAETVSDEMSRGYKGSTT
jgi:hypothetical protein